MAEDVVSRNLALQQEWYGEHIGDTVRRLTQALRITQAQLADVIGLSAPMLSQVASGHRAKIANPSVLSRLQQVAEVASDPQLAEMPAGEIERRLQQVRGSSATGTFTGSSALTGATVIQAALRALASAAEIEDAARRLDDDHPTLAEFLRVYGTGRTAQAREHFEYWTRS